MGCTIGVLELTKIEVDEGSGGGAGETDLLPLTHVVRVSIAMERDRLPARWHSLEECEECEENARMRGGCRYNARQHK